MPVFVLIFIGCALGALVRRTPSHIGAPGSPWCADCTYDLTGLGDDAACPECGSSQRGRRSRSWTIPKGRRLLAIVSFTAILVLPSLQQALAEQWLAITYSWDGHPWDVSVRAAQIRRPREEDLWVLFAPVWVAVSVLPLAALLKRPHQRWLTLLGMLLAAVVITVVWRLDYFVRR